MVRFKHRYITVELDPYEYSKTYNLELKSYSLLVALKNELERLHGDYGVASTQSGLSVKYCNSETRIGIIKCRHGPHKLVASVLPFIKSVGKYKIQINSLYTGATLRQCYKFIKKYQLNSLRKLYKSLTPNERKTFNDFEKYVMTEEELKNSFNKQKNTTETHVVDMAEESSEVKQYSNVEH